MKSESAGGSEHLKVYVLSVKTFSERHANINVQAEKLGLSIEYIWDFDASELTEKDMLKCNTDTLPPESISLVLKHFEAHRRLLKSTASTALILEDDVIMFTGFKSALEKYKQLSKQIDEPHLIFLGGADNKVPEKFLRAKHDPDAGISDLIEHPMSTTEAYLTSRKAAQIRVDWLAVNQIELPADHLFQKIDPLIGIKHFWPPSPQATQGSITGKFSSTLDSSRKTKSSLFLNLKYRYNRVRRQILPRLFSLIRIRCGK